MLFAAGGETIGSQHDGECSWLEALATDGPTAFIISPSRGRGRTSSTHRSKTIIWDWSTSYLSTSWTGDTRSRVATIPRPRPPIPQSIISTDERAHRSPDPPPAWASPLFFGPFTRGTRTPHKTDHSIGENGASTPPHTRVQGGSTFAAHVGVTLAPWSALDPIFTDHPRSRS